MCYGVDLNLAVKLIQRLLLTILCSQFPGSCQAYCGADCQLAVQFILGTPAQPAVESIRSLCGVNWGTAEKPFEELIWRLLLNLLWSHFGGSCQACVGVYWKLKLEPI